MKDITLSILALVLGTWWTAECNAQTSFVVRDVRVFDGERVIESRDVLVENGLIKRVEATGIGVPRGITEVDGRGRTLLPGLIDAHVHLSDSAAADLRQALSFGVTTVFDMFSGGGTRFETIKALRSADAPDMADVRTAGTGATVPGGHPSQMGGPPFLTVADSSGAAEFVRARVLEGSDYIKIIHDDLSSLGMSVPMLDRPTMAGLIAAAHAQGKLAVVHVLSEPQALAAIETGADGLVHLFVSATPSPELVRKAAERRAFVMPTLTILSSRCGAGIAGSISADTLLLPYVRPSLRPMMSRAIGPRGVRSCEGTKETIRDLARRGVRILAGTDAPVPPHTYGASLHGELQLLVDAGLTPTQALVAATSAPAAAFRLTDRGRIAPALRADLVLVDGDPTQDILATRKIVRVWKRGVPARRQRYP